MSPLVLILVLVCSVNVKSENEQTENPREEKLRGALIDAFQNIKKASARGGLDDEGPLTADLIASVFNSNSSESLQQDITSEVLDEDGLTFAEAFGGDQEKKERKPLSFEKSHNVQHIIKAPKTTPKPPSRDFLIQKISESIRNAVNETRSLHFKREDKMVNNSEFMSLDNALRVFDSSVLVGQWVDLQKVVGDNCREQLQEYVNGLMKNRLWAMKMDDAGGRYESMFYWGNNYWVGSIELCLSLNDNHDAQLQKNNSGKSQIFAAWRDDVAMSGAAPPFDTAYYNVRLALTADLPHLINNRRTVHLGVCLPSLCKRADVTSLLTAARLPHLQQKVLAVRAPAQHEYVYIEDPTFQMLLAVVCIVSILLVTATAYDMKLARDVRRRRRRQHNMTNNVESGATGGLDAITSSKGKSIYNVNNNITVNNTSEERLTGETASATSDEEQLKLSVWSELLLSFSMKANLLQIFDQSVGSDTIPVVHGLRLLSMVWVIFGHTCIVVFKYADNPALRAALERSFWFQLVISAVYSVDTFFCLGGMLVTFLYFRTNAKGNLDVLTKGRRKLTSGVLQVLGLIGYRFARLTAPYLFMLGVVEVTMKWFAHNAVFEPPAMDHETCPKYWWRNLLYINTLFPVEQMCMLWSWYLSDDTQFYAVSAILLILATTHFKLSASLTGIFFVSSLMTTGYVSWSSQHIPSSDDPFTSFDKIYDKPWTRLGPYLVGMMTGWILFKTNVRIPMNRVWATVGWAICTATLLFLVFGLYQTELSVVSAAIYSAFSHSLWAACIGWIIIACSCGYGGILSTVLAAPALYPLSRVTYCAYLVHPVVLRALAVTLTHPLHLAESLVLILFLGLTVVSYFFALVISVAFEAPIVTMLKILSPQRKPHRI